MTHHFGEMLVGEITVGPLGEALLLEHCRRQKGNYGLLPRRAGTLHFMPEATGDIYFLPAGGWAPIYGGLMFPVVLPELDYTARIAAIFTDHRVARKVWGYAQTRTKGSIIIQRVTPPGGTTPCWYAHMRFRVPRGNTKKEKGNWKRGKTITSLSPITPAVRTPGRKPKQ